VQIVHYSALRVFVTATLYGIALALVYFAYPALVAIVFAFFFAYLLQPLMKFFETRLWHSRLAAIAFSYIAFAIVVTGVILLLGPRVEHEIATLEQRIPTYWGEIKAGQVPPELASRTGLIGKLAIGVVRWGTRNQVQIQQLAHRMPGLATDIAAVAFWTVVVFILGIFVLKDKDRWIGLLTRESDEPENRKRMRSMLIEIDRAMSRYVWSLITLSAISFVAFALALSVLRLPSALLLAAFQGLMELIFVFGPITAGAAILAAAVFSGHNVVPTLIFLIAWRVVRIT